MNRPMVKLGTEKRPVRFRVRTEESLGQIAMICEENGWIFVSGFEPAQPEDIREVEYLLNPKKFGFKPRMKRSNQMTIVKDVRDVGRNDPCPCGSGKKYKKCCLGNSN